MNLDTLARIGEFAGAIVWVYIMDVIPAVLAAIFVLRMLKLARWVTA